MCWFRCPESAFEELQGSAADEESEGTNCSCLVMGRARGSGALRSIYSAPGLETAIPLRKQLSERVMNNIISIKFSFPSRLRANQAPARVEEDAFKAVAESMSCGTLLYQRTFLQSEKVVMGIAHVKQKGFDLLH